MFMHIRISTYLFTYIHMHIYAYTYKYVCIQIHIHAYTYEYVYRYPSVRATWASPGGCSQGMAALMRDAALSEDAELAFCAHWALQQLGKGKPDVPQVGPGWLRVLGVPCMFVSSRSALHNCVQHATHLI